MWISHCTREPVLLTPTLFKGSCTYVYVVFSRKLEVRHYNSWKEETNYIRNFLIPDSLKQGLSVGIKHLNRFSGLGSYNKLCLGRYSCGSVRGQSFVTLRSSQQEGVQVVLDLENPREVIKVLGCTPCFP